MFDPRFGATHRVGGGFGGYSDDEVAVGRDLLARHPEVSLTAVGVAVHMQSLPAGIPIAVKALEARFPDDEDLGSVLQELEQLGCLSRSGEFLSWVGLSG